jgi:uncharacterized lipoprotein YajG
MAVKYLIPLLLLAGCATPPDASKLSAEQLRELSKDRSTTLSCVYVNTLTVTSTATLLMVDKGSVGSMSVDDQCKVKIGQ